MLAAGGAVLALGAAAILVILNGREPDSKGPMTIVDCPFEAPGDTPIRCGTLAVPQIRNDDGAARHGQPGLTLFFTIVSAKARVPEADPVLVLAGEVGQSATKQLAAALPTFDALNRNRDLIFVDLRGSGRSTPTLTCPGLDPVKTRFGSLADAEIAACATSLRTNGIDPAAFATAENAADLIALRRALGISRWNLLASGYGAVVALNLWHRDSGAVRSLALDSPQAPKASILDLDGLAATQRVFRQLFTDCKAQPTCEHDFPELDAVFEDLTRHLAAQPLPAVFLHPLTGTKTAGALGTADLLTLLTRIIGNADDAGKVPALIWSLNELAHGRRPALADPVSALYAAYWHVTPQVAPGVAAIVTCREIRPWSDVAGARAMAVAFRPFVDPSTLDLEYQAFCPILKLARPQPTPAPSTAPPTLILTGDYDTLTPSYQAHMLAGILPRAETVSFRGLGHGTLGVSPCARDIVARFVDDPSRKTQADCATGTPPLFVAQSKPVPQPPSANLPPPPATITAIATITCPFSIPGKARVTCGTLAAPEHHDHAEGKTISIFFAISHADDTTPLADPVLVLNGGPGQPGSDLIDSGWERLAEIRKHRDIIFVDQRGTGYSLPGFYCRNLNPVAFWHGGLTAADAEACARPILSAGFDLTAFDTVESARDLAALRAALGIRHWNLFGTSYGTALAMELVRRDEAGVRAVVLNSPTTSRASWLDLRRMAAIRDAYRQLFADCAADPACSTSFPDLETVFFDLARRLTESPLPVTYQDPRTGTIQHAKMDFAALLDILTIVVGSGTTAERVPALIWQLDRIARGREPVRPELLSWLYMPYWKTMDMIAYGLNAAIGCREIRPWIDPSDLRRRGAVYQPYVVPDSIEQDYDVFCPAWNLPAATAELQTPVVSNRPTLILTGDYDTLTPTAIAETLTETLSAAQVLRFHAIGHDPFAANACARAALTRFIDAPAEPVALPCLHTRRMPQFIAPPGQ